MPTCWSLQINNVQLSDSGSYICIVQPLSARFRTMNISMEFAVKSKIFLLKIFILFAVLLRKMKINAVLKVII